MKPADVSNADWIRQLAASGKAAEARAFASQIRAQHHQQLRSLVEGYGEERGRELLTHYKQLRETGTPAQRALKEANELSEPSTWAGPVGQVLEGLTLGGADELVNWATGLPKMFGGLDPSERKGVVAEFRRQRELFKRRNPGWAFGAELAGSAPTFAMPAAGLANWGRGAATLGRAAVAGAGTGAVEGAISGALRADDYAGRGEDPERLRGALTGSVLGAATGAAVGPVGLAASRGVTRAVRGRLTKHGLTVADQREALKRIQDSLNRPLPDTAFDGELTTLQQKNAREKAIAELKNLDAKDKEQLSNNATLWIDDQRGKVADRAKEEVRKLFRNQKATKDRLLAEIDNWKSEWDGRITDAAQLLLEADKAPLSQRVKDLGEEIGGFAGVPVRIAGVLAKLKKQPPGPSEIDLLQWVNPGLRPSRKVPKVRPKGVPVQ